MSCSSVAPKCALDRHPGVHGPQPGFLIGDHFGFLQIGFRQQNPAGKVDLFPRFVMFLQL